jgi:phosphoenolpyruvate phosphomutase
MKKSKNLRQLLSDNKLIRIVGAHNAMTAKLVEKNGFEGVWASGLEIATSHGVPDAEILTMRDCLDASSEIAGAVSIPVVSDCDTGFGNSNNVIHMVKKFEAAGVSAVCIEDKRFPKVNSYVPGRQELAPVAEFVGKIMAAKNARQNEDFLVFARVEALIAGWGLDEALKRADAYMEAGADGIFIHSKSETPAEIIEFCKRWKRRGILLICPTTYKSLTEKDMQKIGVNIVIYANHGIRAAIKAINNALAEIERHGIVTIDSKLASLSECFEIQGMHLMKKDEEKYLKSEIGNVKVVIPAAGSKIDDSLKTLLEDRPVGMLDINGRPLIQRNVDTLNKVGIRDVSVVVGYKRENVDIKGVKIIENPDYETKGLMYSIIKGADEPADRNIIVYSDIVFDQELIRKLLRKEEDIILVVDRTYKKTHVRNKELELVLTERSPLDNLRTINVNRNDKILKIGKHLPESEGHYEFMGIACLSRKGLGILREEFEKAKKIVSRGKLVESVSFVEFIQYVIDKGYRVSALEVAEGWMEVHNFNDYKKVCSLLLTEEI